MKKKDYTCYLISNKSYMYDEVRKGLDKEKILFFDGTNIGSFSKLVNSCTESCPTETVIMMSDKMRPRDSDIEKTVKLLKKGYAFVGLYRFGFFGFNKELFRRIGMMDERFNGGGYEDDDIYIRLKEANFAAYLSHDVTYISGNSSWPRRQCKSHFLSKWGEVKKNVAAIRNIPEESYRYNLGPSKDLNFLSWNEYTYIDIKKISFYKNLKVLGK